MKFQILHFDEIESTNTLALEYAEKGRPEGTVIHADFQTEGRGKPGRKWVSAPGRDLLFSVLVRPPVRANQAPMLTQIACRSVAGVLKKEYAITSQFKRPNDILISGKKICGILVESSSISQKLDFAVIGVGLNVNSEAGEIPREATSLKAVLGKKIARKKLLNQILNQLKKDLEPLYVTAS